MFITCNLVVSSRLIVSNRSLDVLSVSLPFVRYTFDEFQAIAKELVCYWSYLQLKVLPYLFSRKLLKVYLVY